MVKNFLVSLSLILCTYSYSYATKLAQIDGTGIYYGEPQFAWVVFDLGTLPEQNKIFPNIRGIVCKTIAQDLLQEKKPTLSVKYPLTIKVNQWEASGRGAFISVWRYNQEIKDCPNLPKPREKQPKIRGEGEREA
mgnify:CR=1 FL=1